MSKSIQAITDLTKAIEAGGYNVAPSNLLQGATLQIEDMSPVMENVCMEDKHIVLQKMLKVEKCKSMLAQFNRQLSYGALGYSATLEGGIGKEKTSDYARITVPMCFYSHVRRVTDVTNMVDTFDGKDASERAAEDAALNLAFDIEFHLFRGMDDYSNGGVFDGNPAALPSVSADMHGLGLQVRQSDNQRNARDLMFSEYGSDETVVLYAGSVLTQDLVEDASVRSALNNGMAERLMVDPRVKSAYNKLAYGKERIVLAGSPQQSTGADLNKQWTSQGTVSVEASQFLRAKTRPAEAQADGPLAPVSIAPASVTAVATPTLFEAGQVYVYYATSFNEMGESDPTASASVTVLVDADRVEATITHPAGTVRGFNVYRSLAGGSAASAKFIGRIKRAAGATTVFLDLGNKQPGFVTGYLIEEATMAIKELAPYSRKKLAETDLSSPEAHFRFLSLAVRAPRKNVLIDNLFS